MQDLKQSGSIILPDAKLHYNPDFLSTREADSLFHNLLHSVSWKEDSIRIFGKTYMQPRLTALFGEEGKSYSYSGIQMDPIPFTRELADLKTRIETSSGERFTTCLLNLYRDGNDSNGWHADNEKELGKHPFIASVSLGATRIFHIKHRQDKKLRFRMQLLHGSLLLMGGPMQEFWLHQIPKSRQPLGKRINLTFRKII
ncbi:alpha-ketoglutarate-dependent dioxygenase AlkB family protein [Robiginitalea aurantiaca]|uniref:Alpha-ketoglutarate-dependent dioxygenase AlkB n=1 Tax=Robiginitalea aurantiaca TaxID=3056915 RepID=A0ABT7WGE7_9FLAO|nr:alpha-ketoglutarate-dependent dioxygenase AlkB [Robiginitalea aurantiaca]MDM9631998.1 alpha-ketoglutarate-dependent dioxygenase AlkB [Robiginitalea aurantiaca]